MVESSLSDIENLSDFLYSEAIKAMNSGIVNCSSSESLINEFGERLGSSTVGPTQESVHVTNSNRTASPETDHSASSVCSFCTRAGYSLTRCRDFAKEPIRARWRFVRSKKLCFKCLGLDHSSRDCKNAKCMQCGKNHHILLHFNKANPVVPTPSSTNSTSAPNQ